MSAMPSPVQADFQDGSLPIRGPMESATLNPGDLDDDPYAGAGGPAERAVKTRRPTSIFRLLITFCLGVGVTVAWYSFGDSLRETVASASPQLAWIAPQPASMAQPTSDSASPAAPSLDQQLSAASIDIDAVRQNVDRIAASQEKIIRSIGQLTTGQELLTKEIAKLQAVEQYILYKNSEPPPTRSPTPAPAPVRRPAAPLPLTPAPAPQTSQTAPAAH
jgi:hypothetical protein